MTEQKKEIAYHAGTNPHSTEYITTNIKINETEKAEVYWFCPSAKNRTMEELEEVIQKQFGCDLDSVIESGIRAFSTRPNYKLEIADDGTFDHDAMQKLADNFKVGARSTGDGINLKKINNAKKEAGMSSAQLLALIEKVKNGQISL